MTNLKLIALMILLSFNTFAAENISYSGRLVTPAGTPVVGPVNMKFDIVVDSDVKCTLNKTSVPLSNGVFNVSLDYGTTCNQFDGTLSKTIEAAYYNDKIPYIRVTDTSNTKTYPDQPIAAVPLAIHSLSGGSGDYNLDLEYTCADGEILKMNSSNLYECSADLQGVTEITAGSGLTGGSVTSTGTVAVDFGTSDGQVPAIASGKIALTLVPDLPGERITSGTIDEARLPTADASNNGKLTSTDWTMFNNKQDDLGTDGTSKYLRSDQSWQLLNTQAVAEHSSNLYFTDARAKAATVADAISDGVTDVAPSQNAVFDALATKADASGDANIVADSITLDTQGAVNLDPYGGAAGNTSEIRFYELSPGSNYTGFKAPDSLASNNIYTLPPNGGTNNYVLSVLNSVTGELGWVDVSTASQVSNTGDVIINADSDSNNAGEVVLQTKGTDRVVIDNDGNVGIGTGTPPSKLVVRESSTETSATTIYASQSVHYIDPPSASSSSFISSHNSATTVGGSGQDITTIRGSNNFANHNDIGTVTTADGSLSQHINASTGIVTTGRGSVNRITNQSSGTIDTAIATHSVLSNSATGTINTLHGHKIDIVNNSGGSITNAYGVHIGNIPDDVSTNAFAFYQVGSDDLNYFAGNVGVGVLAPNEKLTVEGVLSLRESAAPSATANYGKLYVKTDGKAYFKNDAGTEFDITDNGDGGTVTSVATGTGLTGGPITTTGTISIANDGVTATQLADDAVDTAAIVDANVTTAKLANDAVTSAKIAAGAVDSTALGANSVSSSNIVDGTIVNADISGTAAIDYTKLDIANGEIPQAKVNNLTSDLAAKLPLAGGTMTGDIAMGDNDITGLTSLGINGATLGTVTVQAPLTVTSYTWQFPSASGSNGQVLMTDGSGATSWTTVNTSSADGHSLDAADGAPADVVYVDNGGSVGVGTTSPSSGTKLHVSGNRIMVQRALGATPSTNPDANILFSAVNTNKAGDSRVFDITTDANNNAVLRSVGKDIILSGTNVGVGTNSPTANFHLKGSSWTSSTIEATTNDPVFQLTSDGSSINNDWTMRMDVSDSDSLIFRYDNSQRMSLDSSGNLSVSGTITGSSITANDSDTLDGLNSTQFLRSDAADTKDGYLGINYNGGSNNFLLYPNDGRGNMHMYWNSTGTSSPTAKETGAAFDLYHSTGNTLIMQTAPSVTAGSAQTFSNTMVWTGDGDVAIGKNSPSSKLDVNGTVTATSFSGNLTGTASNADELDNLNSTQFLRSDTNDSMTGNLTVSGTVTASSFSGTASNADTLDGINSTGFLRSNTNDTFAGGVMTFETSAGQEFGTGGGRGPLEVRQPTANADALMTFHVAGDYATYFGLDGSTNELSVGGWSMGGPYKIWHEGNDGVGSGLDADSVDGLAASQFLRSDTNDSMGGDLTLNNIVLNAGGGRGLKFWGSDAYKISMGNSAEYNYGPVTDYSMKFSMNGTAGRGWTWGATGSTPVAALHNTGKMQIAGSMTASSFLYTSDKRLKKDVQPLSNALDRVLNLEGVSFKWKKNNEEDIGFIAQEVESNEPSLVVAQENNATNDTPANVKSVKYGNIVALLVEAIKEIKNQLDSIFDSTETNSRSIASLEKENKELKEKLEKQKSDFEDKIKNQEARLKALEKVLFKKN